MASLVNQPCPCGSHKKYKKCCAIFHKGSNPKTALELMKSRYSAFAVGDAKYIIKTTHKENPEYNEDKKAWERSILDFSYGTEFKKLDIIDFIEKDDEAYVTFKVQLEQNGKDASFQERSKFYKVDGVWKYHSGEVSNG
jgi:SEC-C motif-containing protein